MTEPRKAAPAKGFHRVLRLLGLVLLLYAFIAYLALPLLWHRYEERHPALADLPNITHTASGVPGDPLNVGLVGSEELLQRAMHAAKWYAADPITLTSALRIAADVVFERPYVDAPVSPLYLWGRKEDMAFEHPVGDDPRRRHHVRFWRSDKTDGGGRPLWLGAATLDLRVGFSRDTGQITHHIAPDVDHDRDLLIDDLQKAGALASVYWVDGFHKVLQGRNGEGDPWRTDGRLAVGVLALPDRPAAASRPDAMTGESIVEPSHVNPPGGRRETVRSVGG